MKAKQLVAVFTWLFSLCCRESLATENRCCYFPRRRVCPWLHHKAFALQDGIVHPPYCFSSIALSSAAPQCSFAGCFKWFPAQAYSSGCLSRPTPAPSVSNKEKAGAVRVRHLRRPGLQPVSAEGVTSNRQKHPPPSPNPFAPLVLTRASSYRAGARAHHAGGGRGRGRARAHYILIG
jgi:hypothetical protein